MVNHWKLTPVFLLVVTTFVITSAVEVPVMQHFLNDATQELPVTYSSAPDPGSGTSVSEVPSSVTAIRSTEASTADTDESTLTFTDASTSSASTSTDVSKPTDSTYTETSPKSSETSPTSSETHPPSSSHSTEVSEPSTTSDSSTLTTAFTSSPSTSKPTFGTDTPTLPSGGQVPQEGLPTWALVAISFLVSIAGLLTILYCFRSYIKRRRFSDRCRLLESVSQEGFFVGSDSRYDNNAL